MITLDNIVFSLQKAGGISVVWQELLAGIQRSGLQYHCYEYPKASDNIFRQKITIPSDCVSVIHNNVRVHRYLSPKIEIAGPTVFHSSYYRTVAHPEVKNITTVHDFTYELYCHGLAKRVHLWQKYSAIRHSDCIVCISENTKRDLLHFIPSIDEKKVRVIHNGVAECYHKCDDIVDEYREYVLYVGARGSYKNFEFTVNVVKDTPYKLLICGAPLRDSELNMLESALGRNRYKVLVRPSNEELNRAYNSVLCLMYPSSYEGFGIPILEAQRAHCPVIALNRSSIPEVIGNTPLLLDQLSVTEAHKKLDMLKSQSVREMIISEGFENSKLFSWKKMANEYINLYTALLNRGG